MAKSKKPKILDRQNSSMYFSGLFSQVKWGESYTSLILGAIVVIVGALLIVTMLRSYNNQKKQQSTSATQTKTENVKTYTVKEGDSLWAVSQNLYGSGYNWVDLAKANNLSNPDMIESGTKLSVPSVTVNKPSNQPSITVSGSTYKIAEGDSLWDIAVRAYGDGYKWVEISKTNNLANPDLIYTGNILKIPR